MWWILILVAVVGGLLLFEVKAKNKLAQQGKIVLRNRGFHKNAEVFTMGMPVEPEQVTEGLKAINAQLKVGIKGSTEKQSFQIEGGSFSKWTARLYKLESEEGKTAYRFQFASWQEENNRPKEETSMNMLLTAVEKMFLGFDPDTKVQEIPVEIHAGK